MALAVRKYLLRSLAGLVIAAQPSAYGQEISGNFGGGSVIVGQDEDSCDAAREGAIRFDSASDAWEFCNAAAWTDWPPQVAETDPQINTLTGGKWCTTNGSVINCTGDVTDLSAAVHFSGDIAPAALSADQNDYDPAALATTSVLWLTSDSPLSITGLAGGTDGRIITIFNVGSNAITLAYESTSSDESNRFALSGNLALAPGQSGRLLYDASAERWRPVSPPESDPKVNSLTNGDWCTTNGSVVNCSASPPITAETDPKVNTLTAGKWCTSNGSIINCASDLGGGSDRTVLFSLSGALAGDAGFVLSAGGNLGVGDAAPDARMHVAGEMIVGNSGIACSAATEGALRYQALLNYHEFCDGAVWKPIDSAYGSGSGDVTPDTFDFSDQSGIALNTLVTSDIVQIDGIDTAAPVTIGGTYGSFYRICSDAACASVVQSWSSVAGSITDGQYLQIRMTTTNVHNTAHIVTPINVGAATVNWQVTTIGPKRVFITSTQYDGDLGGLSGADAKCQARADAASLGGTYKAWLSDNTTSAASRMAQSAYYYVLLNGTIIANNWTDLADGSIDALLTRNEFGNDQSSQSAWTNTTGSGDVASAHCNSWTDNTGGSSGRRGTNTATNSQWTDSVTTACSASFRLYCFEQ